MQQGVEGAGRVSQIFAFITRASVAVAHTAGRAAGSAAATLAISANAAASGVIRGARTTWSADPQTEPTPLPLPGITPKSAPQQPQRPAIEATPTEQKRFVCPACQGMHRPHTRVPGECARADQVQADVVPDIPTFGSFPVAVASGTAPSPASSSEFFRMNSPEQVEQGFKDVPVNEGDSSDLEEKDAKEQNHLPGQTQVVEGNGIVALEGAKNISDLSPQCQLGAG